MKLLIGDLQRIVMDYTPRLKRIGEEKFSCKPQPSKWSKKEILGHLIDSAQNNIRRFIVSQYEELPLIIYAQDDWVRIADYQNYPTEDLILLWSLLNRHICILLLHTPESAFQRMTETNNQKTHTLEWLVQDYIKHLLHHLHQVLDLEPLVYP
jgi:hypothetical protein